MVMHTYVYFLTEYALFINITGANVLINSNEDVKIADFGISKELKVSVSFLSLSLSNSFISLNCI